MAYKPLSADDKPKVILLSCLAVGVFSFGVVRITTGGGQKALAAKPVGKETTQLVAPGHPDELSEEQLIADAIPNPGAGRDPFVADAALTSATPSVDKPHPGTVKPNLKTLPMPDDPPTNGGTLAWNPRLAQPTEQTPHSNAASVSGKARQANDTAIPDLPACTLKGTLVDGENPVAILETAGERRFLHIGDALADRFYVKAIRLDGITVAHRTTPTLLIRLRNGKPYLPQSGTTESNK